LATAPQPAAASPGDTAPASWLPHIVAAWLAGVFCLGVWNAGGWVALRRLRALCTVPVPPELAARFRLLKLRLNVERPVLLLRSALVGAPVVMGWLRPVVLVPAAALAGLTPQQLDAILAHELAHVRRHDYLVNLFQVLAETLLFYHPAVWWVSRRLRIERELCCDDIAAALSGGRVEYAEALVTMEALRAAGAGRGFDVGPALAVGACDGGLTSRVRRLLGAPAPRRDRRSVAGAAALAVPLILAATLGITATRPAAAVGQERLPAPAAETAHTGVDQRPAAEDAAAGPAPEPTAAENELFERVKTAYGRALAAIGSAEYAYTLDMGSGPQLAHYARSGGRAYSAVDRVCRESAWDGRRVYERVPWNEDKTRLLLRERKDEFNPNLPTPEASLNMHVTWALGLDPELYPGFSGDPRPVYRFLHAREVGDNVYGDCVELTFDMTSAYGRGTMVMRHARRYDYSPVHRVLRTRLVPKLVPKGMTDRYTEELTGVAYATVGAGDAARHFPVELKLIVGNPDGGHSTQHWRIDEATLKINRPIPRSRFVLKPWPNSVTYDFATNREAKPTDPDWSPIGKVGFPWTAYVERDGQKAARERQVN
jgi:beta-lactamase regulating signal transducer with metallopeptidase domain